VKDTPVVEKDKIVLAPEHDKTKNEKGQIFK